MDRYLLILCFITAVRSLNLNIRNLHAKFDVQQNFVYVSWTAPKVRDDVQYQVKYRLSNRDYPGNEWHYSRVRETEAPLDQIKNLKNGDEIEVHVKSELDGANSSLPLIINVIKQVNVDGLILKEDDFLPPLNFQALVLDPYSVRLEWKPYNLKENAFYIVNTKQLTPYGQENLLRQQVKVKDTFLLLRNLEPGHKYEFTIRTATTLDQTSSTAAIVEVSMPEVDKLYEVGNLIITSKFNIDNTGVVNLTWQIPPNMKDQIRKYYVEYAAASDTDWKSLTFDGSNPTIILKDLISDTTYSLKIRTILSNNFETDSGTFTFKTPKIPENLIKNVDVIYSSETSDVKIQWELKTEVSSNLINGYVVYINQDLNAKEHTWRRIQHNSPEKSISVSGLLTDTIYYVRILPILNDGTEKATTIVYKFTTLSHQPIKNQKRNRRHIKYGEKLIMKK
ncbi:unnamed protein product [Bursaphelenchus okinawaensis]|uniref:Fibronectin type-III domain-containing protein n=1 Tax=Bursaphelenchus okinawaensis TaxID=465554 RepID=A0A811KQ75_9BILA|nr:unnamed protein product [Bursaphelenchus okinawaensis]CAG9108524.1 unnamed protein product [Bursaphelenchus okinawaensis]